MATQVLGIAPKGCHLRKQGGTHSIWAVGTYGVDFTGAQLSQYIEQVNALGEEPVIKIDSPGGYVTEAMNTYDYVRVNGLMYWAEGYGEVSSAATLLLMGAGKKRASLAPNAKLLAHSPFGGSESMNEQAEQDIVRIYAENTGMSTKDVRALMAEGDGGRILSAIEAKKYGFIGEVLEHQKAAACNMPAELKSNTMAEKKKTVKVKATLAQAWDTVKALASGAEIEVEVDLEEAVATQLTTKDEEIDALKKQIETLEAAKADEATQAEAITNAEKEATQAKADLSAAASKHEQDVKALTEAHAKAVKDLEAKIPAATRTIANNIDPKIGGDPSKVQLTADQAFAKQVFDQMTPVQLAQYEAAKKRQEKATTTKA